MQTIKQERPSISHPRIWLTLLAIVIFTPAVIMGFLRANDWYSRHYFEPQSPLVFEIRNPLPIKQKEEPKVVEKPLILDYPEEIDTDLEKYICDRFGVYECKTALAVAKAESGLREDAININTNNTIDLGVFQINSVHFNKPECSLKLIVSQYGNTDCAYKIWQDSGWGVWVAHSNGAYLAKLDK